MEILKPCQNTGLQDHESRAAPTGFVTKEENTVSFCFQKKLKQREGLPAATGCKKLRTIADLFRKASPLSTEKRKAGLQAEM
jgi:hypothetical protein